MAGAIFGQAPLGWAVASLGWRSALALTAAIGLVLGLLFWTVVREPRRPGPHASGLIGGFRLVARNRDTWLYAAAGLAFTAPVLALAGLWGVPYLEAAYGLERPAASATVSLAFLGLGLGAPLLGFASDRLRRRKAPLLAAGLLSTLSLAILIAWPGLPLWLVGALLAANGAGASALVLAFAGAREQNPPGASGAAYGIVNTAVVGSGALFQPLIGWLLDLQWQGTSEHGARVFTPASYRLAFTSLLVAGALGLAAALLARESRRP
jgi:MFS family permease